ncbi:MAG: type II secretion system F family protein [Candidatus Doudnabacteria bacterium]|nr:type II secretion system F family protein [Candidatus Doudnabacteria bacterium]
MRKTFEFKFLSRFQTFPVQEKIIFFRNLSVMVHAGVSVLYALESLQQQVTKSAVREALQQVSEDIKNGQRLSVAFSRHSRLFPSIVFETIGVGESTGGLGQALERIAINIEYSYELRRKVWGALTYPFIVLIVLIIVVTGLVWFVLPKLSQLYSDLNATLPLFTRILLNSAQFLREFWWIIIVGMGLMMIFAKLCYKNKVLRYKMHQVFLRVPIFGQLIADITVAQFFRHLETLLASGIPLVHGMQVANRTTNHLVYKNSLDEVRESLLTGLTLSQALKKHPKLFSSQLVLIIEVGERSGKLATSTKHIIQYYERSISNKTQMLSSLLEPVLMIVIGVVIGGLALAVLLPIYQISSLI